MEREVNRIHILAAEGGVHDGWRERMRDGISDHGVDTGGNVDVVDAVNTAQFLCADLPGGGFLTRSGRAECEDASRAYAQDPADNPLLTHTHADHRMAVAFAGEELDHGDIVRERGSRADDLVKVGWVGEHLL